MPKIKSNKTDSIIEKIGVKYFFRLSKKIKSEKVIKLKNIPADTVLQVVTQNITVNAVIIAFLVGALTTVPAVIFEIYFKENYTSGYYYLILALITIGLLIVEIGTLYWLSLKSVHTLALLTGYEGEADSHLPLEYDVKKMMVRSALELEDPVVEYLGIDPSKYSSKKWLVIKALLYKAKIALTSIVARFALRKIALRYGMRLNFIWVAIPITAIWDAVVMYRVIQDAKLRLFGYHLSHYISEEIITDKFLAPYSSSVKEGAIRAVSTVMVLSKNYHPNNIILLIKLNKNLQIKDENNYDDLALLLEYLDVASAKERHLIRTLAGISAVFDGELNRAEKIALEQIFSKEHKVYMEFTQALKLLLLEGSIHKAAAICEEMVLKHKE